MSTSSMKRRIGRLHVIVAQWTSKKCTKKHMHVQSSCFARKNNCFLTLLLLLLLLLSSSLLKVPIFSMIGLIKSVPARQPTSSVFAHCRKVKTMRSKKINDESQFSYFINSVKWNNALEVRSRDKHGVHISGYLCNQCIARLWASW